MFTGDQLATSAPSSMGFEYQPFQQPSSMETNNQNLAKSLEDDYTLQMKQVSTDLLWNKFIVLNIFNIVCK